MTTSHREWTGTCLICIQRWHINRISLTREGTPRDVTHAPYRVWAFFAEEGRRDNKRTAVRGRKRNRNIVLRVEKAFQMVYWCHWSKTSYVIRFEPRHGSVMPSSALKSNHQSSKLKESYGDGDETRAVSHESQNGRLLADWRSRRALC